ncbi:hypothetical protein G6O67_001585 [Ophiocordyceps sinensis]|uniref:Uncharacterized protein n=1 Tax=Ophiocordyceps sinensis TaxID=72228 RepID=A0A8H4PXY8_9HYPO|nr:hypothetical protein G6O67_001585 [Ophiocordyceps sinensis]
MCRLLVQTKACKSAACGDRYRDVRLEPCREALGLGLVAEADPREPPRDDEALARGLRAAGHAVDSVRDTSVDEVCASCAARLCR